MVGLFLFYPEMNKDLTFIVEKTVNKIGSVVNFLAVRIAAGRWGRLFKPDLVLAFGPPPSLSDQMVYV